MKLQFKIFGQFSFLLLIGIFSLAIPYLFIKGVNPNAWNNWPWMAYFGTLFLFTIAWLWSRILTQFISVELTNEQLKCKNIVTRTERTIELTEIAGFKDGFFNGYTISLIGRTGEPLLTLHEHYYSNFRDFLQQLNLEHLGRRPNLLKRLFGKTEKTSA